MISVDRAEEGMVVSSEITDRRGRLLIPAGKELEEKHLRALKMWGIDTIEVEGEGDLAEDDVAIEPWAVEEAERRLDELFVHTDREHEFIDALYACCKTKLARRIQAQGGPEAPQPADAGAEGAGEGAAAPGATPASTETTHVA